MEILLEQEKKKPTESNNKYTEEELETISRFKDSNPKWHAILFEGKQDSRHHIKNYERCIVGEWHGHDR